MAEQDLSRNEANIPSRALVVSGLGSADKSRKVMSAPVNAAFLTQLLACSQSLPAYRRHRRAEPGIVTQRCRAALALA
jgi:hypothetical protein